MRPLDPIGSGGRNLFRNEHADRWRRRRLTAPHRTKIDTCLTDCTFSHVTPRNTRRSLSPNLHRAITVIHHQMPQRPDRERARPPSRDEHHDGECQRGLPPMEKVETNAAPVRIEHGCGQHMVEIDRVCRGNDRPVSQPIPTPNNPRNGKRHQPVPAIMQDRL